MFRRYLSAAVTFVVVATIPTLVTLLIVGIAGRGRNFTEFVFIGVFNPVTGIVFLFSLLGAYLLAMEVFDAGSLGAFLQPLGRKADQFRADAEKSAKGDG